MAIKALEMGVCFHKVPVLGNMRGGGAAFLGPSREGWSFFRRTFIEGFERHVKEGFGNRGTWREFIYRDFGEADEGGLWKWNMFY